jgi:peroxiredoxin
MSIGVGDSVPEIPLQAHGHNGVTEVLVAALARAGRLVLFAVPGAFTPACSARHLPGFVEHAADFGAKGVATLACVAVNDAFVMAAWGRKNNVGDQVMLLADGNCAFTQAMGLVQDARPYGMGLRSQRYALVAEAGRVTHLFVEEPGAFEVSAAPYVLERL